MYLFVALQFSGLYLQTEREAARIPSHGQEAMVSEKPVSLLFCLCLIAGSEEEEG